MEAQDLPLYRIPYSRLVVNNLPENVSIDVIMSCKEVILMLEQHDQMTFLETTIEELFQENYTTHNRDIIRCAFMVGLLSSFVVVCVYMYMGIVHGEFPNFWDLLLPLLTPAIIMWKQVGALESERVGNIAKIIHTIKEAPKQVFTEEKKKE